VTDTADNTPAPKARPAFDALLNDLRLLVRDQHVQKAQRTQANTAVVMVEAMDAFHRTAGRDLSFLNAAAARLDQVLP
jgi:hypothetical protein